MTGLAVYRLPRLLAVEAEERIPEFCLRIPAIALTRYIKKKFVANSQLASSLTSPERPIWIFVKRTDRYGSYMLKND